MHIEGSHSLWDNVQNLRPLGKADLSMRGKKNITLEEALRDLTDPRAERVVKYTLCEILFTAFAGILCGATSYAEMADFGRMRLELYRQYLPFENGIPSAWTLRSVLCRLKPEKMHEVFAEWMFGPLTELREGSDCDVIAVDGKQARRTKDAAKKPLHVVSAFSSAAQLVLGQVACEQKSNEITAIPRLLDLIDVTNATVTIDAMGTQHGIASAIIEKGADYILPVKKNRKVQYSELADYFAPCREHAYTPQNGTYAILRDYEHGRHEIRECWICDDVSGLPQTRKWKGVHGAAMLRYRTEGSGRNTDETQYVIFSQPDKTAAELLRDKRKHWGIENKLHWVLDVTYREDDSRARSEHSAENLNVIRHMTFNILKQMDDQSMSLARRQKWCLGSDAHFNQAMEMAGFMTIV